MSEKFSLHRTDIIMSYRRGNSADREEALYAILRHFDLTYTEYQILLLEADAAPTFEWQRHSDQKVRHVFIPDSGPFPKAKLYNLGAKMSSAATLLFNDADCVASPHHVSNCIKDLLNSDTQDVLCPYWEVLNINGSTRLRFLDHPQFEVFQGIHRMNLTADAGLLYERNAGGVFIFRRKDFINIGGLDPGFTGWGGEDSDLFFRATRLGLRWSSVRAPLFHLNHDDNSRMAIRDQSSVNVDLGRRAEAMPIEQLQRSAHELSRYFTE
jgi:predicted glycosyltransferase involved in capsule biosynthesis